MKRNTKKVLAGAIACMTLVSSISVQQVSAVKVAIETKVAKVTKAEKLAKLSDEKKKSSIGFYKDDVNHQEYDISNAEAKELLKTDFDKEDIPAELVEENEINMDNVKDIDDIDSLDLYSFTTIKKDNSRTLYVFDTPVKYYDENKNEVKFIDNTFKKSKKKTNKNTTFEYENKANDVKVYVPKTNNESIMVENSDEYSLMFQPVGNITANVEIKAVEFLGVDEQCAEYIDVFGKGTHLQYVPQNSGIKENIILEKNINKYTFDFVVDAKGLEPKTLKGKTIDFVRQDNKEVAFTLGELFIKDSYVGSSTENNHMSFDNSYSLKQLFGDKYQITYVLDKKFLNSKSTQYPVLIDPSISPISSIKDAPVYSAKSTTNFASNAWIEVGDVGGSYGTGYGFFQTTALKNYTYINPKKITKATLRVYEGSGTTYSSEIKAFDTDDTWKSTSITWKNKPSKDGSALDTKKISSSGYYEFKITSPVKYWLGDVLGEDDAYSAEYGIMLAPTNSSQKRKDFCSANYGTESKRPTIKIDYTDDTSLVNGNYFIWNAESGKYLDADTDGNVRQLNPNYNSKQQWQVLYKSSGYYTLANSFCGATGYLSANTSDSNAKILSGGSGNAIKYKIIRNNWGNKDTFRIMSKQLNDLKALCTASTSNGANVKHAAYNGNSCSGDWSFITVNDWYKRADLSVSKISITGSGVSPVKNITTLAACTYSAQIANTNYSKAAASTTKFVFANMQTGATYTYNIATPAIQLGATTNVSMNWTPPVAGNYQLTVTANATGNVVEINTGNNVLNKTFSAIKGYRATVNNYFDEAYNVLYASKGNVSNSIKNLNTQINTIFKDTFGIIITNNTPTMISSLADNCKHKRGLSVNTSTIETKCPGGASHTPSCTNGWNLYCDFISRYPGAVDRVSVLWTGNRLFEADGSNGNRSFYCSNYGISLEERMDPSSMAPCITHELSHFFGAPDHYHEILSDGRCRGGSMCKKCNPTSGRATTCIMDDGWQNVLAKSDKTSIHCQGCYNDIVNYIKNHPNNFK